MSMFVFPFLLSVSFIRCFFIDHRPGDMIRAIIRLVFCIPVLSYHHHNFCFCSCRFLLLYEHALNYDLRERARACIHIHSLLSSTECDSSIRTLDTDSTNCTRIFSGLLIPIRLSKIKCDDVRMLGPSLSRSEHLITQQFYEICCLHSIWPYTYHFKAEFQLMWNDK